MRHRKKRSRKEWKLIAVLSCTLILVLGCAILFSWFIPEQFVDLQSVYEKKGDQALTEKSYDTALQYFQKAVSEEKNQAGLYLKIGRVYLKRSNIESAKKAFEKALEINPLDNEAQKEFASILFIMGDMDSVREKLAELETRMGNDPGFAILCGDFFMNSEEYKKAESMYVKALRLNPDSPRGIIKLAICKNQTGEKKEAQELISQAVVWKNYKISDLLLLADYYFLIRDFVRAESILQRTIEKDPGDIGIQMALYRLYLGSGQVDQAKSLLKSLEKQQPKNPRFKLMLADWYVSELDMEKAETMLIKAKELGEERFDFYALMGKFWLCKEKFSYAVSNLETAVDSNPGLVSVHYLLGVAYFAGGQAGLAEKSFIQGLILNPYHIKTLLALSGLYYKKKEYSLALQYLERAISLEPANPRGFQVKGLCLLETDEYLGASQEFSKAWLLGKDVSSLFFLAESFEKQKAYASALKIYEDVLDQEPEFYEALQKSAILMRRAGKGKNYIRKKILGRIDSMIRQGRTHPELYGTAARISLDLDSLDLCRKYLELATIGEDVSSHIYMLWADLHQEEGELEKAESVLTECTKKHPSCLSAWLRLAGIYVSMNRNNSARDTLELAAKQLPVHPELMGNLAWLLIEEGKELDRALTLARRAYEKMPEQAWVMDTLGWAYYHKKAYSQAEWVLAEAERRSPDQGVVKYHQGMVFYRQGKLLLAREKLEQALKQGLSETDKEQIHDVLAKLDTEKNREDFNPDTILNPEKETSFFQDLDDDEDLLKPDWSNLK